MGPGAQIFCPFSGPAFSRYVCGPKALVPIFRFVTARLTNYAIFSFGMVCDLCAPFFGGPHFFFGTLLWGPSSFNPHNGVFWIPLGALLVCAHPGFLGRLFYHLAGGGSSREGVCWAFFSNRRHWGGGFCMAHNGAALWKINSGGNYLAEE